MFIVGNTYFKKDLYRILNVPEDRQRGEWDTGYREYEGNIFIFSNVGIPGRTGHDYNNYWDGDLFFWQAKNKSHIQQPSIQKMLSSDSGQKIYLFTRTEDRLPFTFEGTVVVQQYYDTTPVRIIWRFDENPYALPDELPPTANEPEVLYEGGVKSVRINKYERNPLARRMCIEYYGCFCNVCKFDFHITYGEHGKNYIHVHHLVPISSIGDKYIIDPERDLIPVCPNCHSMIHIKQPMLSVPDLKLMLRKE